MSDDLLFRGDHGNGGVLSTLAEPLRCFAARLNAVAALDEEDHASVNRLAASPTLHRRGADLGDDGDGACRILISGWACRVLETPWGSRQILDFVLPGDAIGLTMTPQQAGLYRVVALSKGATADACALRDHLRVNKELDARLHQACNRLERAAVSRVFGHFGRMGAPTASQAMAHLLLELRDRMDEADLVEKGRFLMPVSQENLREALGITVTQVYRILTQLRLEGLIARGAGWFEVTDLEGLALTAASRG